MKFNLLKFKKKSVQVKGLECLNCQQPLTGNENFCSYCGQKNSTKKLSFGVFLSNLISGFFNYDSRFWITFIPLLTQPGKVAKDYIEGKRARFVNPFQLYLHVSIIFFLILGISNRIDKAAAPINNVVIATQQLDSLNPNNQQQLDSILNNVKKELDENLPNDSTSTKAVAGIGEFFKQSENYKIKNEYEYHINTDTAKTISVLNRINDFKQYYSEHPNLLKEQALKNLGYEITFWNTFYYQQVINTNKNIKNIKEDGGKEYVNKLFSYVSISLFIFLPVFTLFLMLIYWRRKFTYMEHLVFVFNTQTVFFLLLSIFFLIGFVLNLENVAWVFIVLFLIYLYKALRYFYQQSRLKTVVKFILLNSYYLFLASVGFTIILVLSFFIS